MSQTIERQKVTELLFAAVADLNQQLRKDRRLKPSLEVVLTGAGGQLDSLGLLNLIVLVEQRVESDFQTNIMLADDEALAKDPSPFRTLGTLAEHIQDKLLKQLVNK